jgi:hypothetical protein
MKPWTQADKESWFRAQTFRRSYADQVVTKIQALRSAFEVTQYGALLVGATTYPLFLVRSKSFSSGRKTVLITGGVHGYETSGVQGALEFMRTTARRYEDQFNFVCAPCISPWAYETINRWNPRAIDPNRSFLSPSPAEECELFMRAIAPHQAEIYAHFDLHETTDTDETVFRPALEARDGIVRPPSEIPDGFYTVGDSENPCREFQAAIVDSVRKVTHIAPADAEGKLIGDPIEQEGVINYPVKALRLCAGVTNAKFTTTTEVYPDSPRLTDAICIQAQITAVVGGLEFIRRSFG